MALLDIDGASAKNAHLWARQPEDWYVEPEWCSRRLFEVEAFEGPILDPSCGLGRIVRSARQAGLIAFGHDIVKRSEECLLLSDFLTMDLQSRVNIVSNPPFGIADAYAKHALRPVGTPRLTATLPAGVDAVATSASAALAAPASVCLIWPNSGSPAASESASDLTPLTRDVQPSPKVLNVDSVLSQASRLST